MKRILLALLLLSAAGCGASSYDAGYDKGYQIGTSEQAAKDHEDRHTRGKNSEFKRGYEEGFRAGKQHVEDMKAKEKEQKKTEEDIY